MSTHKTIKFLFLLYKKIINTKLIFNPTLSTEILNLNIN